MMKLYGLLAVAALTTLFAAPSAHAFAAPPKYSSSSSSSELVAKQQQHHRSPPSSNKNQQQERTSPTLFSTSSSDDVNPYTSSPQLDTNAIVKYSASAITELTLFATTFQLLDVALAQFDVTLPFPAAFVLFYACSLKSRVFNPLNNQRPDRSKAVEGEEGSSGFRDRVMPSWTPPGVTFPIMWLLIIGPIRAYSASLILTSTGSLFCIPIMAFILHLTIGDIWNTINNTEKRYGASVIGVLAVVLSAANAANQYYIVDPVAGKLLGGTLVWLCTAAALITDTWRLNPSSSDEEGGKKKKLVPLFPVVGEAETSFMWFANKER